MGGAKPPVPESTSEQLRSYLQYLPKIIGAEDVYRGVSAKGLGVSDAQFASMSEDQKRVLGQQRLQAQAGPTQYAQQIEALQRLDPQSYGAPGTTGQGIRAQLGQAVSSDLASGYNLPPALQQGVASQYLGRQVQGGNVFGNAPATAADIFAGNAAQQYYQQHLQNAGNFLAGPTPEQALLAVQPIAPDRSSAYVNPSGPGQLGAQNYQNMLAQYQASGGGRSPWAGAAGGAIGGATAGSAFGPYGAAGGAIIGGVTGYFSDARLKNHAIYIGRSPSGIPIHEFNYNECSGRWRGVIAQEILSIRPDAVTKGPDGYYRVDYSKIDVPLEEIPN